MEKKNLELASIQITFLLEPNKPWASLSRFQKDLADWLKTKNVEGDVINGLNDQSGNLIVYLREIPKLAPPMPPITFKVKK